MERILRGKFLVRKSKLDDGTEVLTLSGVFHPINFDINQINDNDEMWISEITVKDGGIRFTEPKSIDAGSIEDFIEGKNQLPSDWKNKSLL